MTGGKGAYRRILLAVTLVATLVAAAWVSEDDMPEFAEPEARAVTPPGIATHPENAEAVAVPRLQRRKTAVAHDLKDIFASASWTVQAPVIQTMPPIFTPPPSPPPQVMMESPPPSAPPVPFRYLGRLQNGDKPWQVFLLKDNTILTVHAGDVLDGVYRVQGIENGQLKMIYMPLQVEQFIAMGSRP